MSLAESTNQSCGKKCSFQEKSSLDTDRQTNIQAGRHTDKQADRQTGRQTSRQIDRQTGRQAGRQPDR